MSRFGWRWWAAVAAVAAAMAYPWLARGAPASASGAALPTALLVTSHGAVVLLELSSRREWDLVVNHSGVAYSSFLAPRDGTLMVAVRDVVVVGDVLLDVDANASYALQSRFTHDVVVAQGSVLLVADTSRGEVHVYSAVGFALVKRWPLFTRENHINSLSPVIGTSTAWAVLHNRGRPSSAVLFNYVNGSVLATLDDVGADSHHWVPCVFNQQSGFLSLSSRESALVFIPFNARTHAHGQRVVVYQGPRGHFLKGLALDAATQTACFSVSLFRSTARERARVPCELRCVALATGRVVFEHALSHAGLVNSLALPSQLCPRPLRDPSSLGWGVPVDAGFTQLKALRFNASLLQASARELMAEVPWTHRADVNNWFITLVTQRGNASDDGSQGPFAPVPGRVRGYLKRVLASLGVVVGRARLMLLPAGESVRPHADRVFHVRHVDGRFVRDAKAGYWGRRVRIHVPLLTSAGVWFTSGSTKQRLRAGAAYVFDKSAVHSVDNASNASRVHLVVDAVAGLGLGALMAPRAVDAPLLDVPVYERWADAPVFDAMPVETARGFLDYLLEHVDDADAARKRLVRTAFDDFLAAYSSVGLAQGADDALLEAVACDARLAGLRLGARGDGGAWEQALALWPALEAFVRQLRFVCAGSFDGFESAAGPPCFQQR